MKDNGDIFYPNYTITATFKTSEEGSLSLLIASNASYIITVDPMYYVPKDIWVRLKVTIFVSKDKTLEEIEHQTVLIEQMLQKLLELIDMINGTVIPKLNDIPNYISGKFAQYWGSVDANALYEYLKDTKTQMTLLEDLLNRFSNTFPTSMENLLTSNLRDLRSLAYIVTIILIIAIVSIALNKKPKKRGDTKLRTIQGVISDGKR